MYPINHILPDIIAHFRVHENLTLEAPTGAGKTTIVPLEFLSETWLGSGKIIMLEPRRIAARAAAKRMSEILGSRLGEEIGYRVKMDHKVTKKTRIEVVTEGILIRMIQNDPELNGVKMVIFDEFHERSLDADFGLALTLDLQEALRPDLKILVMSATLDGDKVAALINSKILTSKGRSYAVEHKYLEKNISLKGNMGGNNREIENEMLRTIEQALKETTGSILAFLPGVREIENLRRGLQSLKLGSDVIIAPLYGMMKGAEQDTAIKAVPKGKRKITLATAIAQTSLTIEGINLVVDSGLIRRPIYDASSGMTRLETRRISKATADQRAGRAGRLSAGVCYRLWTKASHAGLSPYDPVEIKQADLVPLALELAAWGAAHVEDLKWLDLPDDANFKQAGDLLQKLEALDQNKHITDHGKSMAKLAMHPRLSHMVLKACGLGQKMLGLKIAALLSEKDILNFPRSHKNIDMRLRIEALNAAQNKDYRRMKELYCDQRRAQQVLAQVQSWKKNYASLDGFTLKDGGELENIPMREDIQLTGVLLGFAYPDRIGMNRGKGDGGYLLSGGKGAAVDTVDSLAVEKYLTAAHLFMKGADAQIFLTAPISFSQIEGYFGSSIKIEKFTLWDKRNLIVSSRQRLRLGSLILKDQKLLDAKKEDEIAALIEGIRHMGLACLPWKNNARGDNRAQGKSTGGKKALHIRARVQYLYESGMADDNVKAQIPDMRDHILLETLEKWLAPYLDGMRTKAALQNLNMTEIIQNLLGWQGQRILDEWLPEHIIVPSGSKIPIDYSMQPPVLAVRLQEMFGLQKTPSIMKENQLLVVHLLSPAGRPLQVTQDLAHFWESSYIAVKKEMRGRYPKHHWPDDPLSALPTNRKNFKKN